MVSGHVAEGDWVVNPIELARWQIMDVAMRLTAVLRWLATEGPGLKSPGTALFIGCTCTQIGRYAGITIQIIENPTTVQPVLGRCMFY